MNKNPIYHKTLPDFFGAFLGFYEFLISNHILDFAIDPNDSNSIVDQSYFENLILKAAEEKKPFSISEQASTFVEYSLKNAYLLFIEQIGLDTSIYATVSNLNLDKSILPKVNNIYINNLHSDILKNISEGSSELVGYVQEDILKDDPAYYEFILGLSGLGTATQHNVKCGLISYGLRYRLAPYELLTYSAQVDLYNLDSVNELTSIKSGSDRNEGFIAGILGKSRREVRENFKKLRGKNEGCPVTHLPSEEVQDVAYSKDYKFPHTFIMTLSYYTDWFIRNTIIPSLQNINPEILYNTLPGEELLLLTQSASAIDKDILLSRGMKLHTYENELNLGQKNHMLLDTRYANNEIFIEAKNKTPMI
jgi:hypothetical protein